MSARSWCSWISTMCSADGTYHMLAVASDCSAYPLLTNGNQGTLLLWLVRAVYNAFGPTRRDMAIGRKILGKFAFHLQPRGD
mmetsp:Transcript_10894/g.19197  ORF Transcript_10894/g.19197 Transcript_10894/m.19197 type:complete len:82 (-) Transcript_10894:932-1177(-)